MLFRSDIPILSYVSQSPIEGLKNGSERDTNADDTDSPKPPYAISNSFVVLAPLFIGAGNYLLITRLCKLVLAAHITHIHHIPVDRLTRIFVTCDIISFLIQVSGSGIASSGNWQGGVSKIGTDILIVGLATQVMTFAFFLVIVATFHAVTRSGKMRPDAGEGWKKVLMAVYISSTLIIVSKRMTESRLSSHS